MAHINKIGIVKNNFKEQVDPNILRKTESRIIIDKNFEDGLYKIDENRYIQVMFIFHLSSDFELVGPRYGGEVKGVFASRSPRRPTNIGLTTVELLGRKGNELLVKGLDAIDGTPVIDIKPYSTFLDEKGQETENLNYIKNNPRSEITRYIAEGNLEKLLIKSGTLHGHYCSGLSIGVRASAYLMNEIKAISDGMEELIAIVEANNCMSDGVQYVTGCTFANNALVYRDFGKNAVTLSKRDGNGIRVSVNPDYRKNLEKEFPEYIELFNKVIRERAGNEEDYLLYKKSGKEVSFSMLNMDFDSIFSVKKVKADIPEYAPMHDSILCDCCGENVMATRILKNEEGNYCYPCSKNTFNELNGAGIRTR
mgnify:CR=1 FL=1